MKKSEMMSWCCAGILVLGTGCTMFANKATSNANTVAPEPGTRTYFDQNIRGAYAFDGGELVKIYSFYSGAPSMPMSPGMPIGRSYRAQWVEGLALQIMSNNLVVIGKSVTNASGVVAFQRSRLVSLVGTRLPAQGSWFRLLTVSDGSYTYNDGTRSGTLYAYREVPEPTFEDYLKIYERDSKIEVEQPIISIERVVNQPLPPGLTRPSSIMPNVQ